MRTRTRIAIASGIAGGLIVGSLAMASQADSPAPRFGPVPKDAMKAGKPDLSAIPDYVSVLGHNGNIVGYVKREDLFPTDEQARAQAPKSPADAAAHNDVQRSFTVYDINGNPIGHFLSGDESPGTGFVPDPK